MEPGLGQAAVAEGEMRRRPAAVYRIDPAGDVEQVISTDTTASPNGIAFSPDFSVLYVTSSEAGPGTPPPPAGDLQVHAFYLSDDGPSNGRAFFDMVIDGTQCSLDGLAVDVHGNLRCAMRGELGLTGVAILDTGGRLIGRIRLPEICANLAFGGPRRSDLYMTATSGLYRLRTAN